MSAIYDCWGGIEPAGQIRRMDPANLKNSLYTGITVPVILTRLPAVRPVKRKHGPIRSDGDLARLCHLRKTYDKVI